MLALIFGNLFVQVVGCYGGRVSLNETRSHSPSGVGGPMPENVEVVIIHSHLKHAAEGNAIADCLPGDEE
jgi:hypothetical protein